MKQKNNQKKSGNAKLLADDVIYSGDSLAAFEENSEVTKAKNLRKKFITSEEDDALSENRTEDQEEQNTIHSDYFDNQPRGKKHDITPSKH